MTNYFAENLQLLLDKSGMGVYTLAPLIDASVSSIYRWLDPKIAFVPRTRTRVAIANVFGVDPVDLVNKKLTIESPVTPDGKYKAPAGTLTISGLGPAVASTALGEPIPLLANTQNLLIANVMDDDVGLTKNSLTPCAKAWLPPAPIRVKGKDNLVVVQMPDDSMAPEIKCGDLVYIEFEFQKPLDFNNGDLVLADRQLGPDENKNTPALIRKLVIGDHPGDAWLVATNTEWPGTRQVRASTPYGKVVGIFRKL